MKDRLHFIHTTEKILIWEEKAGLWLGGGALLGGNISFRAETTNVFYVKIVFLNLGARNLPPISIRPPHYILDKNNK